MSWDLEAASGNWYPEELSLPSKVLFNSVPDMDTLVQYPLTLCSFLRSAVMKYHTQVALNDRSCHTVMEVKSLKSRCQLDCAPSEPRGLLPSLLLASGLLAAFAFLGLQLYSLSVYLSLYLALPHDVSAMTQLSCKDTGHTGLGAHV